MFDGENSLPYSVIIMVRGFLHYLFLSSKDTKMRKKDHINSSSENT